MSRARRSGARHRGSGRRSWKISENCYKLHACCGHTHSAIDLCCRAARDASAGRRSDALAAGRVDRHRDIRARLRDRQGDESARRRTRRSSASRTASRPALLEGRVSASSSSPRIDSDPTASASRRSRRCCRASASRSLDDLTAKYPAAWPARVTLTLRDGSRLCDASDYPRGNPENPVDTGQLGRSSSRSSRCAEAADLARAALDAVDALAEFSDVAGLFVDLGTRSS